MLIPFDEMFRKHRIRNVTGIMHVGAHHAQELKAYSDLGIHNVFWVEGDHDTCMELMGIVPSHQSIIEAVIGEKDGEKVTFHVANNGQSSSILELGTHAQEHPDVVFVDEVEVETKTLDSIYTDLLPRHLEGTFPLMEVNFLNLDLQGAELKALKGAEEKLLPQIDYIYTEVNRKELYKGCVLLPELDDYLAKQGFRRIQIKMTPHGWGDAMYRRRP